MESGTAAELKEARKAYWRKYKAQWRRRKRKEQKEYTVSFTPAEMRILEKASTAYHRSCTRFIKESTLAYAQQQMVIPDPDAISQIRELLALNYTMLQQFTDDMMIPCYSGTELMQRMASLERNILTVLTSKKVINQAL